MLKTAGSLTPFPELTDPPALLSQEAGGKFPCEEANEAFSLAGDYPCVPIPGYAVPNQVRWSLSTSWLMESYST